MGQPASLHKPRGLPFVQPGSLGFHLTSCSDAAAPTGQPQCGSGNSAAGTVRTMDKTAHSIRKGTKNPFPDR